MDKNAEKEEKKSVSVGEEKAKIEEGLPTVTSPYTQYKDLEDYKRQGYGTQGHLEPKPGRGAASSTDAPTDSASSHAPLPTK